MCRYAEIQIFWQEHEALDQSGPLPSPRLSNWQPVGARASADCLRRTSGIPRVPLLPRLPSAPDCLPQVEHCGSSWQPPRDYKLRRSSSSGTSLPSPGTPDACAWHTTLSSKERTAHLEPIASDGDASASSQQAGDVDCAASDSSDLLSEASAALAGLPRASLHVPDTPGKELVHSARINADSSKRLSAGSSSAARSLSISSEALVYSAGFDTTAVGDQPSCRHTQISSITDSSAARSTPPDAQDSCSSKSCVPSLSSHEPVPLLPEGGVQPSSCLATPRPLWTVDRTPEDSAPGTPISGASSPSHPHCAATNSANVGNEKTSLTVESTDVSAEGIVSELSFMPSAGQGFLESNGCCSVESLQAGMGETLVHGKGGCDGSSDQQLLSLPHTLHATSRPASPDNTVHGSLCQSMDMLASKNGDCSRHAADSVFVDAHAAGDAAEHMSKGTACMEDTDGFLSPAPGGASGGLSSGGTSSGGSPSYMSFPCIFAGEHCQEQLP
jgi:hypothetical protein